MFKNASRSRALPERMAALTFARTKGGTARTVRTMMKKKTLGDVLKQRRGILGSTQRQLAARLGVKASHVAYLEKGRRRPSLSLLARLANVMGLEKEPLFLLAHPEARVLLADRNSNHDAERPENSWRKF